jgi:hypothetical protein
MRARRTSSARALSCEYIGSKRWSNGQTEGQIKRPKTLKRGIYGRASIELLRARKLPLSLLIDHTD